MRNGREQIVAYSGAHSFLVTYLGLPPNAELPFMYEAVAGAVAGALQVIPACPVEAVKIRMQVAGETGEKLTIPAVIQDLGFAGLVRGFDVTAGRDIVGGAVFFSIFASGKQFLSHYDWFQQVAIGAFLVKFLAGFVAAVPAAIVPTPFDVVKTRMQAEPKPGQEPFPDSLSCLKDLLEKEGPGALLYVRLEEPPHLPFPPALHSLRCSLCFLVPR